MATRYKHDVWGKGKERRFFEDAHWGQLIKWQEKAAAAGEYHRVFIGSMCDIFDGEVSYHWRDKLWSLFDLTPNLIKLLVTKRPECIPGMYPLKWLKNPRNDVWFLFSVSDQQTANERLPIASTIPAIVKGISYEPGIGPVDWLNTEGFVDNVGKGNFQWMIVGGESVGSRPFEFAWALDTLETCQHLNMAFYMKQMGYDLAKSQGIARIDRKGETLKYLPENLRIRKYPA